MGASSHVVLATATLRVSRALVKITKDKIVHALTCRYHTDCNFISLLLISSRMFYTD